MNSVSIFGVGLIGGSFALALRQAGFTGTILGVSSPATIAKAIELGVIDNGATLEEAAKADLVFLAQPISVILDTISNLAPHLGPQSIVTDAGSTKLAIAEAMLAQLPANRILPGHPMAGKEVTGVAAADPGLFRNRTWILCPNSENAAATQTLKPWIERIGAIPVLFDPAEHDRTVALTSHLPQFLSTALALTLAAHTRAPEIAGPGVIDMTRLALSSVDLWRDIATTNRENIQTALDLYLTQLNDLRQALNTRSLDDSFARASSSATRLRIREHDPARR